MTKQEPTHSLPWRTFFSELDFPAFIVDRNQKIVAINSAAREIFNPPEETIIGKQFKKIFNLTHQDLQSVNFKKKRPSKTPQPIKIEVKHRQRTYELSCAPIYDTSDQLSYIIITARDITETIKIHDALLESQEKYSSLFSNAKDGILLLNLKGKILDANSNFLKITGYEKSDIIGKDILYLAKIFNISSKKVISNFKEFLASKNFHSDWLITTKEGKRIYVTIFPSFIKSSERKIGVSVIISDVTKQKKTELALKKSERRFRTLFNHASDDIFLIDPDHPEGPIIIDVNESASKTYGYSREELIGQPLSKLEDTKNRQHKPEGLEKLMNKSTDSLHFEAIRVRKDGSKFPVDISARLVEIDREKLILSIERDISERNQVQEKLIQSEKSYRSIFDNATDAIYIQDREGRFVEVNQGAINMYGYPREYFIGKTPEPLSAPGKNDMEKVRQHLEKAFQGEPQQFEFWGKRSNGEIFPKIVRLNKGTYFGQEVVIAFALDITERKKAEEQLRKKEERFRRLVQFMPVMVLAFNKDGTISFWNRQCELVTGYSAKEIVGNPEGLSLLYPDATYLKSLLNEWSSRGDDFVNWEMVLTSKGGVKRTVALTNISEKVPIPGWKSWAIGIDMTDVKEAEQNLRLASIQWRSTFDAIKDAITLIDLNGTIKRCNRAMAEFIGKPFHKIINYPYKKIIYKKLGQLDECPLEKVKQTLKRQSLIMPVENRFYKITVDPQFNDENELIGFVYIISDITEHKLIEQALMESEKKYRHLIQNSNDAIYLLYNRKFEIINDKFQEMFGVTLEDVNDPNFDFIQLVAPESRELVEQRLTLTKQGEKLEPKYEFTALSKDGRKMIVETSVSYINYKDGIAVQGIIRDITDRKQAEDELKTSLKEKEILLKEIHHRVKNNLQVIISLLRLQAKQIVDKQALSAFDESINRIYSMAMVHEKLYQSQNFSKIDLKNYVKPMIERLFYNYNVSDRIKLNLNLQDISVGIDKAIPCGLILNELVSNVFKHAFPDKQSGSIIVQLLKINKNTCELVVEDNGVGISKNLDFEKSGSLGLNLIRLLVDQINGTVKLYREDGTKFVITFTI